MYFPISVRVACINTFFLRRKRLIETEWGGGPFSVIYAGHLSQFPKNNP